MDNLTIKYTNILSENFQNLTDIALKEKQNYLTAKPFPNIVLNNFFKDDFLNIILNEFPDLFKSPAFLKRPSPQFSTPTIAIFSPFLSK